MGGEEKGILEDKRRERYIRKARQREEMEEKDMAAAVVTCTSVCKFVCNAYKFKIAAVWNLRLFTPFNLA